MASFLTALLKSLFAKGIDKLWINRSNLSLYFKTLFGKYRNQEIRFSISYLFRIRIPSTNSYLLVLNRRIANQLQPVGGVYKRYGDDKLFEKWGYVPDNKKNGLGTDQDSFGDLRFRVRGKNVISVIKWFEEGKEREISAEREFFEELLKTNILDPELFASIRYRHLKRVSKNLKYSEYHNCHEIMIYDVMELIPTHEQAAFLMSLLDTPMNLNKGYAIVECDDIEQLRIIENGKQVAKIGEHTKLIINKN